MRPTRLRILEIAQELIPAAGENSLFHVGRRRYQSRHRWITRTKHETVKDEHKLDHGFSGSRNFHNRPSG